MRFMVPALLWTCILCGCAGANTESTTEGLPVAGPRVIQNGSPPPQWTFFPLPSKTTTPQNIVAGPDDGNMWFIEATGSSLDKIGITTGHIKRFPTSVPLTLLGLALGPDRNLWFTGFSRSGDVIVKASTAGQFTTFSVGTKMEPAEITAGPDGNLWFTDFATNAIGKVTTGGVVTEYSVPSGGRPYDIVLGRDGNLWFDEENSPLIGKTTPAGIITEYPLPNPNSSTASGMTAAPDGNVWVAESAVIKGSKVFPGHHLDRVTPTGSITDYYIAGTNPFSPTSLGYGDLLYLFVDQGLATYNIRTHQFIIVGQPPNAGGSGPMTVGPDDNLWFTQSVSAQVGGQVGVYIRHVLSVSPTSLTLSVGQSGTLTASETLETRPLTASSSNPAVATVMSSGMNTFKVTGVAAGTCTVTVADHERNRFLVPVTVH